MVCCKLAPCEAGCKQRGKGGQGAGRWLHGQALSYASRGLSCPVLDPLFQPGVGPALGGDMPDLAPFVFSWKLKWWCRRQRGARDPNRSRCLNQGHFDPSVGACRARRVGKVSTERGRGAFFAP